MSHMKGSAIIVSINLKTVAFVLVKYSSQFRTVTVIENDEDGVWIVGEISWKSLGEMG